MGEINLGIAGFVPFINCRDPLVIQRESVGITVILAFIVLQFMINVFLNCPCVWYILYVFH